MKLLKRLPCFIVYVIPTFIFYEDVTCSVPIPNMIKSSDNNLHLARNFAFSRSFLATSLSCGYAGEAIILFKSTVFRLFLVKVSTSNIWSDMTCIITIERRHAEVRLCGPSAMLPINTYLQLRSAMVQC